MQQLSASPPTGYSNYLQIASGSTTYTNINLSQSIETANCYDLAGQTVTLSFWYKVPVNWTNQWIAYISSNTSANTKISGGSSGTTSSTGLTLTNTATWTKATLTYTIPSNAQTVGVLFSNGNNNIINGSQFQIAGVQLEVGSTATPFERRLYGQELANCQRYYYKSVASGGNATSMMSPGPAYTTVNSAQHYCAFPVTMRVTPTASVSSVNIYAPGINTPITAIATQNSSTTQGTLNFTVASGLTINSFYVPITSNGYIDFSAEL
jgi:hypothetical protein